MSNKLKEIQQEEEQVSLLSFNAKNAFSIGSFLAQKAIEENLPLCVSVFVNGREMFHFSSDECTPNHDQWLKRKRNTVLFFHHSTKFMGEKLNQEESLLVSKYGLKSENSTIVAGGVPILIQGCGVIGALCVSGMKPEEDHQLAIEALIREKRYSN